MYAPSPILGAIPAIPLKYSKNARLAIWVQDLWPENISATGYVKNGFVLAAVGLVVRAIYAFADLLLVQSIGFIEPVAEYARGDKIVYYANSAPVALPSGAGEEAVPLESVLKKDFCVVFAGNLGRAQSIETIVGAAALLRDVPGLRIVIVGSGSMSSWLEAEKARLSLDNITIAGRVPMSAMPRIFHHAGCLLVTLRDERILALTIPSKIQASLAAGKPIVAAVAGESARVIEEAGAGFVSSPESAEALADSIRRMYASPEPERARMGERAKRYFLDHFEMNKQADRLISILEDHSTPRTVPR